MPAMATAPNRTPATTRPRCVRQSPQRAAQSEYRKPKASNSVILFSRLINSSFDIRASRTGIFPLADGFAAGFAGYLAQYFY